MAIIYTCSGQHFKVYDNATQQVLAHPEEPQHVDVAFNLDVTYLVIIITKYKQEAMRVAGQKNRVDIYLLQDLFRPLLDVLSEQLDQMQIRYNPRRPFRYGQPMQREGRQGVPRNIKIAELNGINATASFKDHQISTRGATAIIDSEVPGRDQTRWQREGASRQIHIGVSQIGGTSVWES